MSHTIRFALALAIGIAAGAVNWLYIKSQVTPAVFVGVRIKSDIKIGEVIEESQLEEFEMIVPKESKKVEFSNQFYSWDQVDLLVGTPAGQPYREGEILLTRDSLETPVSSEVVMLGPFRLLSVDDVRVGEAEVMNSSGDGEAITIAVDPTSSEARKLFDILEASNREDHDELGLFRPGQRIAHIVLHPTANGAGVVPPETPEPADLDETEDAVRPKPIELKGNEVATFVSLEGVTVVPGVLVEGNQISFVLR